MPLGNSGNCDCVTHEPQHFPTQRVVSWDFYPQPLINCGLEMCVADLIPWPFEPAPRVGRACSGCQREPQLQGNRRCACKSSQCARMTHAKGIKDGHRQHLLRLFTLLTCHVVAISTYNKAYLILSTAAEALPSHCQVTIASLLPTVVPFALLREASTALFSILLPCSLQ